MLFYFLPLVVEQSTLNLVSFDRQDRKNDILFPLDAEQSDDEQKRTEQLSLQRTRPPVDVPGYEARSFLGSGAYGEVWVALDKNTGRRVAIKFFIHPGCGDHRS